MTLLFYTVIDILSVVYLYFQEKLNNGKTLDVNIEFEIKNNSLRVYFE